MPEGSPARGIAAGLLLAALAAAVVWTLWPTRDSASTPASASASASVEPAPSAPPVDAPAEPEQPEQPAGPATGDYAELATAAELEHPDTDPHIRRWYDRFRPIDGTWRDTSELWDLVVHGLREEATGLGAPFDHPLYDGDTPQPALVAVIWGDTTTQGRGDVAVMKATYRGDGGRVTTRVWAALITSEAGGRGHVAARMEPFDLYVTDYASFEQFQRAGDDRVWEWIQGVEV